MNKEWKEVMLKDVSFIDTGYPFKSVLYEESGLLKVVRGKNVTEAKCRWGNDAKFWNHDTSKLEKYFLEEDDIVIGMDGSKIGKNKAKVLFQDLPCILAQRVGRVRANSKNSQGYLWQVINSNRFEFYIDLVKTGTSIPHMSLKQIGEFKFKTPPLAEQKAIAKILGDLDAKIELNRKMNQTLENMAQALFNSWFVDFDPVLDNALAAGNPIPEPLQAKAEIRKKVRSEVGILPESQKEIQAMFPSSFVFNEDLGKWIPGGWEVKKISDLAEVIGGGTPSTKVDEYYCDSGIPWLSPKDLSGYNWKHVSKGAKDITDLGLQKSSAKLMPKGTVLFSSRAPIGYIAIAENDVSTNQGFKSLVPKTGIPSEFLFQYMKDKKEYIESISSGSTFKEVSGTIIKSLEVIVPSIDILTKLDLITNSNNKKLLLLQKETETLIQQRDVLLPQLVSGKVRVPQSLVEQMEKELEKEKV